MPNRIACHLVAGKLLDYSADRLSAENRQPIERHLQTCAACRAEVEEYRRVVLLMADAGRAQLPASGSDWQMLAARMEEANAAQRTAAFPAAAQRRFTLTLVGTTALIVIGIALATVRGGQRTQPHRPAPAMTERPGRSAKMAVAAAGPTVSPPHPQQSFATSSAAGFGSWQPASKREATIRHAHRPLTSPRRQRQDRRAAQARQLLAQAALKIDALEQSPPPRELRTQRELRTFIAALQAARQPAAQRASVQLTVLKPDLTLLDSRVAFVSNDRSGGSWVRQTLMEQPNGDRTTETVAATFGSDSPDSFLDLQTCAPSYHHLQGDTHR